ncbi:hypothetical protein K8R47_02770, partial [archaeon]|nr:hypothetical protein [archaeon]
MKPLPELSKEEKLQAEKFREEKRKNDPNNIFTKILIKSNPTIKELKEVVEKNFPEMWLPTSACLSVIATLKLKDLSDPVGLNLQGAPSSTKTTILSFFYDINGITYKTDNFTPKSFVSHANIGDKELLKIDLLPKIKNKTVIVPELAPIFGKRKEDLTENLSILTRVFDGEGLETDSGTKGRRGYSGDY